MVFQSYVTKLNYQRVPLQKLLSKIRLAEGKVPSTCLTCFWGVEKPFWTSNLDVHKSSKLLVIRYILWYIPYFIYRTYWYKPYNIFKWTDRGHILFRGACRAHSSTIGWPCSLAVPESHWWARPAALTMACPELVCCFKFLCMWAMFKTLFGWLL